MIAKEIRNIEDCLDGTFIKDIVLGECISKEHIMKISESGKLKYYPSFQRPFYKISFDGYYIKGVEGNDSIRIHYHNPKQLQNLIDFLTQFNNV